MLRTARGSIRKKVMKSSCVVTVHSRQHSANQAIKPTRLRRGVENYQSINQSINQSVNNEDGQCPPNRERSQMYTRICTRTGSSIIEHLLINDRNLLNVCRKFGAVMISASYDRIVVCTLSFTGPSDATRTTFPHSRFLRRSIGTSQVSKTTSKWFNSVKKTPV